jgi:hypothetical protein
MARIVRHQNSFHFYRVVVLVQIPDIEHAYLGALGNLKFELRPVSGLRIFFGINLIEIEMLRRIHAVHDQIAAHMAERDELSGA